MPKKKQKKENVIFLPLILLSGIVFFFTNLLRAQVGWFESGEINFLNSTASAVFFALITGFVLAKVGRKGFWH